jgi:hypothetical protein
MATDGRQKRIPENMFNDHEAVADVPSRSGAARLAPSVVLLLFVRLLLTLLGRGDKVLIGLLSTFTRLSRVLLKLQFPHLTAFHAAPTEIIFIDQALKDYHQERISGSISELRMMMDAETLETTKGPHPEVIRPCKQAALGFRI